MERLLMTYRGLYFVLGRMVRIDLGFGIASVRAGTWSRDRFRGTGKRVSTPGGRFPVKPVNRTLVGVEREVEMRVDTLRKRDAL
jgi:hypothetical protein